MSSAATMQQVKTDAAPKSEQQTQQLATHSHRDTTSELIDQRSLATAQRRLQEVANHSVQSKQLKAFQQAAQLKAISATMNAAATQMKEGVPAVQMRQSLDVGRFNLHSAVTTSSQRLQALVNKSSLNAPVQRVIVRVGYNQAHNDSWNPFVHGAHRAVASKVNLLPGNQRIYDYAAATHDLAQSRAGDIADELHVVGHGQPGRIAGHDGAALAQDIRNALGHDAAAIQHVRLHSCFSNVAPDGGASAGAGFAGVFNAAAVEAATGIHYADNARNLPPRFTGFKYGAQSAKRAFVQHFTDAGTNLRDEAHADGSEGRANIIAAARSFGQCVNPMERFMRDHVVALYQGLDPQGGKTVGNQTSHDRVEANTGSDIDQMPPDIPYPQEIGSLRGGLSETYHFTAGLWNQSITHYRGVGADARVQQLETSKGALTTAYQTAIANYGTLIAALP